MSVLELTMENFEAEVLQSDKPVLIDFWATWCGPCRMMSPVVDEFAEEHPEIAVGKVNVDDQPQLAGAFGIESIPTLIAIKDGKAVGKVIGARPKEDLEALFAAN
jgi:thioredoxin 1